MPQDVPDWAEPRAQEQEQGGPPPQACESICNPTSPGRAAKECGCYEPPGVPIVGAEVLVLIAFAIGAYKLW